MFKFDRNDKVLVLRLLGGDTNEPDMVVSEMTVVKYENGVAHFRNRHGDELICPIKSINRGDYNPYVFNANADVEHIIEQTANEYECAMKLNDDMVIASGGEPVQNRQKLKITRRV